MNHFKNHKNKIFFLILFLIFVFFVNAKNSFAICDVNKKEFIVSYKNLKNFKKDIKNISNKRNFKIEISDVIKDLKVAKIHADNISSPRLAQILKKLNSVNIVELNTKRTGSFIPNDTNFSRQWAHRNTGQKINGISGKKNSDIHTPLAWDNESSNSDTVVAIIDSGVDYTQSDLSSNMWNPTGTCLNDLGNPISGGCPLHGWNYVDNNNNPMDKNHPQKTYNGHGTFVASQLASISNNGNGISGMSRFNKIKIMAIKFNFDVFSEIKAINFAKNNGAKIINASFGGAGYSQIEKNAIEDFGGVFVAAAGNGGDDSVGDYIDGETKFFPCSYDSNNLICVAATNQYDKIASFSNYGVNSVDIAAPGVNLYGIYRGKFTYGNGTSFATPLVSGTCALLLNKKPTLTPKEIIENIKVSGDYLPNLNTKVSSSRRLNVFNAINFTKGAPEIIKTEKTPIYRLYNTKTGAQLYTIGVYDRNKILKKFPEFEFTDGTPAFWANITQKPGLTPIFRLYNRRTGVQLYTRGEADKNKILAKFRDFEFTDGAPAFYASLTEQPGLTPIYRLYNTRTGAQLYTRGEADKNKILAKFRDFEFTDGAPAFWASLNP